MKVDPVPEMYAHAFDRLADVSGRLRGLRHKTSLASEPPPPGVCDGPPDVQADIDNVPTVDCRPSGKMLLEFEALLGELRALL